MLNKTLKKGAPVIDFNPTKKLLDKNFIAAAIFECLLNNDPEGVIEVINSHIEALEKKQSSSDIVIQGLKAKNPTIKTIARVVHESQIYQRK